MTMKCENFEILKTFKEIIIINLCAYFLVSYPTLS